MKRKPDTMLAVMGLFVIGLLVSGFSSISVSADEEQALPVQTDTAFDRSVSRR